MNDEKYISLDYLEMKWADRDNSPPSPAYLEMLGD